MAEFLTSQNTLPESAGSVSTIENLHDFVEIIVSIAKFEYSAVSAIVLIVFALGLFVPLLFHLVRFLNLLGGLVETLKGGLAVSGDWVLSKSTILLRTTVFKTVQARRRLKSLAARRPKAQGKKTKIDKETEAAALTAMTNNCSECRGKATNLDHGSIAFSQNELTPTWHYCSRKECQDKWNVLRAFLEARYST